MRDVKKVIGKRLLALEETSKAFGHPGANYVKTIAKNDVTGLITSYIPSGYFEIEGTARGNWYVKDDKKIQVVEPDRTGTASIFDRAGNYLADAWNYNVKEAAQQSEYLSDGLKKSIKDVSITGASWGKDLRFLVIGLGAIMAILLLRDIIKTIK